MKNQRKFKVIKFEKPFVDYEGVLFSYGIEKSCNGKTEIMNHFKFIKEENASKKCEELNHKFFLTDFDQKEIEEFFNGIDFTILFKKVNEVIGLELSYKVSLDKEKENGVSETFFIASNEDIAEMNNPISNFIKVAWKSFKVETFGTWINVDKNGNLYISGDLCFWCKSQCGGNTGHDIISFKYDVDGWEIITEEERRQRYE